MNITDLPNGNAPINVKPPGGGGQVYVGYLIGFSIPTLGHLIIMCVLGVGCLIAFYCHLAPHGRALARKIK